MFTKIKNTIIALLLVGITIAGVYAYRDVDDRLRTVGDTISTIVGKDTTMSAYYQMPQIRVVDYPENVDIGVMTPEEQIVFLDILEAVENGIDRIPYSGNVDLCRVLTHLGMYYGCEEHVCEMFAWTTTEVLLYLDVFAHLAHNKVLVDARVDEMLSTLKEGSDRFKLFQIAAYISERVVYDGAFRESIDGLNGKGVCATYAMLFYKAASRLGIQTYICYGYAGDGYHAWNMVELDGNRYFYDVTWFDNEVYDFLYLHSADSWGRNFQLNDIWAASRL